jgi:hypothetical protein
MLALQVERQCYQRCANRDDVILHGSKNAWLVDLEALTLRVVKLASLEGGSRNDFSILSSIDTPSDVDVSSCYKLS